MTVREIDLTDLEQLDVHASEAEVVEWRGRRGLRLNGVAWVHGVELADATIEVDICAEEAAYPGIAFHGADALNFELAYAVPHCSGLWDAVQYDPVFHGSNTWQLYHGAGYQKEAAVPTGQWFRQRVDVHGSSAAIRVGDQQPLTVVRLAHGGGAGTVGVWTYLPATFANLRISPCSAVTADVSEGSEDSEAPPEVLGEWFMDGFGRLICEPNGVLNLNRYLPAALGEVRLIRQFELPAEGEIELDFGFSDELSLAVDEEVVFTGSNTFRGFDRYGDRGYVHLGAQILRLPLERGLHRLAATLKVTEGFGWGLVVALRGEQVRWLPAVTG
jgi:hypothetical protein